MCATAPVDPTSSSSSSGTDGKLGKDCSAASYDCGTGLKCGSFDEKSGETTTTKKECIKEANCAKKAKNAAGTEVSFTCGAAKVIASAAAALAIAYAM